MNYNLYIEKYTNTSLELRNFTKEANVPGPTRAHRLLKGTLGEARGRHSGGKGGLL